MSLTQEILIAILDAQSPSLIASKLCAPVKTVIDHLWILVGRGSLRLTDIYFAFSQEQRVTLKAAVDRTSTNHLAEELKRVGLTLEEVDLFNKLKKQQVVGSEMYEFVSEIELAIHEFIRNVLVDHFGGLEEQWWREGIPLQIRKKCQSRREEDEQPSDSGFAYTDLIDLSDIIAKNWGLFQPGLHATYQANRKLLQRDFVNLNDVRKAVMHPVKRRKWREGDFQFVRQFREHFWSAPAPFVPASFQAALSPSKRP